MRSSNVQFSVAVHIMTVLGYYDHALNSSTLAKSVAAEPSFVRRSLSKLVKAGLVKTTRGKTGASVLSRPAEDITLLEIYRASAAPGVFTIHEYPVDEECPISCHIKDSLSTVFNDTQASYERALGRTSLADIVADIRRREG
ncbi:Rrf2 family transcriptional regulator [Singulisphaera rosea]